MKRHALHGAVASLLLLGAVGCRAPDSAEEPARRTPGSTDSSESGTDFSTLAQGDTLLGWRVDSVAIAPDPVDGFGWMGSVDYAGVVDLSGEFRPHMDFPEVDEICFFADPGTAGHLPRFPNDVRRPWFCFSNRAEAAAMFGNGEPVGRARITIDRFYYRYQHTDVYNRARITHAEVLPSG